MQDIDWNDLKYLLALQRAGTLAEAGRRSGVSETTVARRLKHLENALGIKLFIRNRDGKYQLDEQASVVFEHAEKMEQQNLAMQKELGEISGRITGTVRLSSVPVIINRILLPALPKLNEEHPNLTLELVPDARNLDLSKREADLAIRFSRPTQGGLSTKTQILGHLEFATYCACELTLEQEEKLDWIGYDDAHASLPQARWTEALRRNSSQKLSPVRITDIETALQATINGAGKSLLPVEACKGNSHLRKTREQSDNIELKRDVWLLSHIDQEAHSSISTVKSWLKEISWK